MPLGLHPLVARPASSGSATKNPRGDSAVALPVHASSILRNFEGMATTRERSMEWPRQSRIAVGSAASHGVSIVSSKLFPSILT